MLLDCPDEAAASRRLTELQERFPLPPGCRLSDSLLDRARVGELELGMVGLVADAPGAQSATGAAAGSGAGLPVDRAFFELLERLAIQLAPSRMDALAVRDRSGALLGSRPVARVFPPQRSDASRRASRSNGVALHTTWPEACAAAQRELIERDHVLRSFRGEFAPRAHDCPEDEIAHALRAHYSLEAYQIDPIELPTEARVMGVFLFPRSAEAPLAYGFAAADSGSDALLAARREALQRLAFLWGEPLSVSAPLPSATPDYHQDYYLYPAHHAQLRAWLTGAHGCGESRLTRPYAGEDTSFVDLTPDTLIGKVAVARAASPRARTLRFGLSRHAGSRPPHPIV